MVTLITQVAQNYLLIRTTQQRLSVAERNLRIQQESVRIATAKHEAGEVSALDVEQARTLFHNTEASLPSLEISLQQFKNALAVLLGRPPQDMSELLSEVKPVPTGAPEITLGMPQDLIRRRPDIRAAERQLASQSAQIGFAVSELYPHFVLGGSIGTTVSTATTLNFSDLFSSGSFVANLFGSFQWNIFNYGRLKNNVRLQDAIFQQFLEDYREIVLQAQAEVENAIVAFLKSRQQLQALQTAADAAQRAVDVSTEQYQDGLVDFNTVLSTLTSLVNQQDLLATAQGTVADNLVEVYASLGGAWEIRQSQDPLDLIPEGTRTEMLDRGNYWKNTFRQE
jgi:NodT family efflux transporter outer membrane factor (OMF) lipoprotein